MSRIIAPDSPLSRLPAGLYPPQKGWIDGIRYSVDIADIAMHRLCADLQELTRRSATGATNGAPVDPELQACAVADAWTFVDAVWRLKRFLVDSNLPRPPGPPHAPIEDEEYTVDVRQLRTALKPIKQLRDGYQHLDNHAPRIAENGDTVWGHLNWIALDSGSGAVRTCLLVTGDDGRATSNFSMVNPAGKTLHGPIDHIVLHAFESSANLSEVYLQLISAVRGLERVLGHQVPDHPQAVGGFLVVLDVQPQPLS
jgi:hypothetical protein